MTLQRLLARTKAPAVGLGAVALVAASLLLAGAANPTQQSDPPFVRNGRIYTQDMKLTFDGSFTPSLMQDSGKGPWFGPTEQFGVAEFVAPSPTGPAIVADSELVIEPKHTGAKWISSQVQSVDRSGAGFSQQFGYFVLRAKLPTGRGVWPAFWLRPAYYPRTPRAAIAEVDAMEVYGPRPDVLESTLHYWPRQDGENATFGAHRAGLVRTIQPEMLSGFHDYGVYINSEWTIFFFDGQETARMRTLPEEKTPMYMIIDYALTKDQTDDSPSPGPMVVEYARAYQ